MTMQTFSQVLLIIFIFDFLHLIPAKITWFILYKNIITVPKNQTQAR